MNAPASNRAALLYSLDCHLQALRNPRAGESRAYWVARTNELLRKLIEAERPGHS